MSERNYSVRMAESDWDVILKLLDQEEKKYKAILQKTYDRPSDTIASSVTREKYASLVDQVNNLRDAILAEAN